MIDLNRLIEVFKYILIGIIQGVSEIFPISSSGHLSIAYIFLNISNQQQLNLTIFLHFASSLALCIYFRKIISRMIKGFFQFVFKHNKSFHDDFMLTIYLLIASIPAVIVGTLIKPLVEQSLNNILIICINFSITGLILLFSSQIRNNNCKTYTFKNTIITGVFQCLAMFPGISRSGITLFGSKVAKLNEEKGKEFTFLLLLPISIGSTIMSIFDISKYEINSMQIYLYIISFLISFVFTLFSLKIFNKITKIKPYYYSIYLFVLSFIIFCIY